MAHGRFDQERALEVATRRLAFGIVQKGPALKCRYAVLCDFFAGYLQDILSNDWLKQLQRECKLAKREREKSTGPGRGRIGWNLLTSKAICARAGKSWCFASEDIEEVTLRIALSSLTLCWKSGCLFSDSFNDHQHDALIWSASRARAPYIYCKQLLENDDKPVDLGIRDTMGHSIFRQTHVQQKYQCIDCPQVLKRWT